MRRWQFAFVVTALALLLQGCGTTMIRSDVTTFHEWPADLPDKSYVFERTKEQENDLEYRNYENLVRVELKRLGFVEAPDIQSARLKAALRYGINARDVRVSYPVVADPLWYGSPWRGSYGPYYSPFYSPFYDPFWYGPPAVGRREENYQLFTRELHVSLARAADGKKLYDTTVVSEGRNGSLAAIMPYMVRSAFADFPGKSGAPRRVELKS
jgi:hypothetical protein